MKIINVEIDLNSYQDRYIHCQARHKAYFGEFRSGKTMVNVAETVIECKKHPGITQAIIRNFKGDLKRSTIPQFKEFYDWDQSGENFDQTYKILELSNGSQVYFLGLDKPKDVKKLKNIALGGVWIDQAEEVPEDVYDMAVGRMSQSFAPCRSRCSGNFEGKNWCWYRFFQKPLESYRGSFSKSGVTRERDYGVFCGDEDHVGFWPPPFLNEKHILKGYYENLVKNNSSSWCDKYVFGMATGNAGLVHGDFDEKRHLVSSQDYFDVPEMYERFDGMDYGYSNPTCWLFAAYDRDKDIIYIVDEYYVSNQGIDYHGPNVKMFYARFRRPRFTVGCPRAFQTESTGRTPADVYAAEQQIVLAPYPIGFETRVEIVNRRFKQNKIKIFDRCVHLRRQLEGLAWNNIKTFEDHAVEAFQRLIAKVDTLSVRANWNLGVSKAERPLTAGFINSDF